ncbi:MAG: hypothetical protein WBN92_10965 [Terriglobia bacterium]
MKIFAGRVTFVTGVIRGVGKGIDLCLFPLRWRFSNDSMMLTANNPDGD